MKFMQYIFCTFFLLDLAFGETHWSYKNIDKWPGICTTGKLQSPIDLVKSSAQEKIFTPFQFENYDQVYQASVKNNLHSVEVRFRGKPNVVPTVFGANLPSEFVLDSMHFHWHSEHTIDNRRFPLELHLVHYDSRLGNATEAKKVKGGLAVLGVLFEISPDDEIDMEPLVEIMDNIAKYPNKVIELESGISPKNFLPCDTAGFFRYSGSLTTPGCDEVVTWTVFTNTLTLSKNQVAQFEDIQGEDGPLFENFRPMQKTNGRPIYLKISPINSAVSKASFTWLTFAFCLCISLSFLKIEF